MNKLFVDPTMLTLKKWTKKEMANSELEIIGFGYIIYDGCRIGQTIPVYKPDPSSRLEVLKAMAPIGKANKSEKYEVGYIQLSEKEKEEVNKMDCIVFEKCMYILLDKKEEERLYREFF